uniref:Uncharacterized protein n=1 Tax=Lepeophtheirus salmonis TaxID=72036 RepID=A0A0K2TSR7_LEPSM
MRCYLSASDRQFSPWLLKYSSRLLRRVLKLITSSGPKSGNT